VNTGIRIVREVINHLSERDTMDTDLYKNRYAVVYKAPDVALYGASAKPEYYVACWQEVIDWQVADEWNDAEWHQFHEEQDEERDSAYAELERLRAQN